MYSAISWILNKKKTLTPPAHWSEQIIYPDSYSDPEEFDKILKSNEGLHRILKDICEEWNEDCDEDCDNIAHSETCKMVNIAEAKKAMKEQIKFLTTKLEEANTLIFNLEIANRNSISMV